MSESTGKTKLIPVKVDLNANANEFIPASETNKHHEGTLKSKKKQRSKPRQRRKKVNSNIEKKSEEIVQSTNEQVSLCVFLTIAFLCCKNRETFTQPLLGEIESLRTPTILLFLYY